jgi:hypothetical protein
MMMSIRAVRQEPARHFLDQETAQICAGAGGKWKSITTFSHFLATSFNDEDSPITKIVSLAPHLLATFGAAFVPTNLLSSVEWLPEGIPKDFWPVLVVNIAAIALHYGVQFYLKYAENGKRIEKDRAAVLLNDIIKSYEKKSIDEKIAEKSNDLAQQEISNNWWGQDLDRPTFNPFPPLKVNKDGDEWDIEANLFNPLTTFNKNSIKGYITHYPLTGYQLTFYQTISYPLAAGITFILPILQKMVSWEIWQVQVLSNIGLALIDIYQKLYPEILKPAGKIEAEILKTHKQEILNLFNEAQRTFHENLNKSIEEVIKTIDISKPAPKTILGDSPSYLNSYSPPRRPISGTQPKGVHRYNRSPQRPYFSPTPPYKMPRSKDIKQRATGSNWLPLKVT